MTKANNRSTLEAKKQKKSRKRPAALRVRCHKLTSVALGPMQRKRYQQTDRARLTHPRHYSRSNRLAHDVALQPVWLSVGTKEERLPCFINSVNCSSDSVSSLTNTSLAKQAEASVRVASRMFVHSIQLSMPPVALRNRRRSPASPLRCLALVQISVFSLLIIVKSYGWTKGSVIMTVFCVSNAATVSILRLTIQLPWQDY